MKQCTAPECSQPHLARGLCQRHYDQYRYQKNPEHHREKSRQYRLNNPDKARAADQNYKTRHADRHKKNSWRSHCLRKYGITPEQKQQRLAAQVNKCANPGCGATEPGGYGTWHTDHDHETGQLRGELCSKCNMALSLLKEQVVTIRGLADYLESYAY